MSDAENVVDPNVRWDPRLGAHEQRAVAPRRSGPAGAWRGGQAHKFAVVSHRQFLQVRGPREALTSFWLSPVSGVIECVGSQPHANHPDTGLPCYGRAGHGRRLSRRYSASNLRSDLLTEDVVNSLSGILPAAGDRPIVSRTGRLLDLLMDGLHAQGFALPSRVCSARFYEPMS